MRRVQVQIRYLSNKTSFEDCIHKNISCSFYVPLYMLLHYIEHRYLLYMSVLWFYIHNRNFIFGAQRRYQHLPYYAMQNEYIHSNYMLYHKYKTMCNYALLPSE